MTWTPKTGAALALVRPNYYVVGFTGFGSAPTNNRVLRAPYQDGGTLVDTRLDPREITLTVAAVGGTVQGMWDRRRTIVQAFNPKLGIGTLKVATPTGRHYEIFASPDGAPTFSPPNNSNVVMAQLDLLAPHPYWSQAGGVSIGGITPNTQRELTTDGDIPSWLEVDCIGPLTNPGVSLVGHDPPVSVGTVLTIFSGETLTLRAGPGAPSATLVIGGEGVDASAFLIPSSDLVGLRLPMGTSNVQFSASAGTGTFAVRHKHWFEGI